MLMFALRLQLGVLFPSLSSLFVEARDGKSSNVTSYCYVSLCYSLAVIKYLTRINTIFPDSDWVY